MHPPALAVFSPSSSTVPFPRRRSRSLAELEYRFESVQLGPGWVRDVDGQAGTPEERADELSTLALLAHAPMLMASTGGFLCNQILPHLQYGLLNELRPTICGFSDVSTLLLALYAKTSCRCLHGPAVLPTYGAAGGVDPYTHASLIDVLRNPNSPISLHAPLFTATQLARWDVDDDEPLSRDRSEGWKHIHKGQSVGPAIVSNLEVLEGMLGTPYLPSFDGAVLIIEEAEGPIERTFRRLEHLAHAGLLKRIAALVFGRLPKECDPERRRYSILHEIGARHKIPVLADFDVGHTDPKVTIQIGSIVRLDTESGEFILNYCAQ